jgi:hypothetical protein
MSAATSEKAALDVADATADELLSHLEEDTPSDIYAELMRRLARPEPLELEIADDPLAKLIAALAAAQGQFPTIEKTQTATVPGKDGTQGYSYADLGDVLAKVRPVLSRHGLALVQRTERVDGAGAKVLLVTELHHTAGGVIESVVELGQSTSNPQQFGGALTYLRRYEAVTLLGIAAEEDRDAQDVVPAPRGAAAPVLPDWATSLTKERGPLVLAQLERVMPHETARGILVNVYERTGGLPAIFLPFCKAIADALNGDPAAAVEEQDTAAEGAVAAGDVEQPSPAPADPADSDVPPDMDGLPSGAGLFDDADSPVFAEGDEKEEGVEDGN